MDTLRSFLNTYIVYDAPVPATGEEYDTSICRGVGMLQTSLNKLDYNQKDFKTVEKDHGDYGKLGPNTVVGVGLIYDFYIGLGHPLKEEKKSVIAALEKIAKEKPYNH